MLTLSKSSKYIKLESSFITGLLADPSNYTDVELTVKRNCCATYIYQGALDITNPEVSLCAGEITWSVNLENILDNDLIVKSIDLVNIVTGIEYSIDLSATQFLNSCYVSSSNVVDACASATAFKAAIAAWFSTNTNTVVKVDIVANRLYLCNLPANMLPISINYTDDVGTIELEDMFASFNSTTSFLGANAIFIQPNIVDTDTTEFPDGIYTVTLKINQPNGSYIQETNCFFFDVETKCLIAAKIQDNINANEVDTNLHMLHYALTSANNCGCNCNDLCYLYSEIVKLLGTTTTLSDGCGC